MLSIHVKWFYATKNMRLEGENQLDPEKSGLKPI